MKKFTHCISNPPYQRDVSIGRTGTRNSVEIYPDFQYFGVKIAEYSTMIYPANWQKNIQHGLGPLLLHNGMKRCDTLNGEDIFTGIILPVSIVYTEEQYTGGILNNGQVEPRNMDVWVSYRESSVLLHRVRNLPKLSPGLQSSPKIANAASYNGKLTIEKVKNDDVYILLKQKPGKAPDSRWFCEDREEFLNLNRDVDIMGYRVCMRSRIVGRQALYVNYVFTLQHGLRTEVFKPGVTHGMTWAQIATFHSLHEAENFSAYLNTVTVSFLAYLDYSRAMFGSYIPDLGDYSDANPLFQQDVMLGIEHHFYGLSLDERLWVLWGLSEEEKVLLRQRVIIEMPALPELV